jgi:hypothetical protein
MEDIALDRAQVVRLEYRSGQRAKLKRLRRESALMNLVTAAFMAAFPFLVPLIESAAYNSHHEIHSADAPFVPGTACRAISRSNSSYGLELLGLIWHDGSRRAGESERRLDG